MTLTRFRAAYDALCGRVTLTRFIETDAQAELVRATDRVLHGLTYMKDLPMALIDDINAIKTAADAAIAAEVAKGAANVDALTTANATIATLNQQISDADAAAVNVAASYAPAPVADPAAPADPNAPVA